MRRQVFVFGSNLAGRHGAGSALEALQHWGARYGKGVGPAGASYAITTKDINLRTLRLESIREYVTQFVGYAQQRQDSANDRVRDRARCPAVR